MIRLDYSKLKPLNKKDLQHYHLTKDGRCIKIDINIGEIKNSLRYNRGRNTQGQEFRPGWGRRIGNSPFAPFGCGK